MLLVMNILLALSISSIPNSGSDDNNMKPQLNYLENMDSEIYLLVWIKPPATPIDNGYSSKLKFIWQ